MFSITKTLFSKYYLLLVGNFHICLEGLAGKDTGLQTLGTENYNNSLPMSQVKLSE